MYQFQQFQVQERKAEIKNLQNSSKPSPPKIIKKEKLYLKDETFRNLIQIQLPKTNYLNFNKVPFVVPPRKALILKSPHEISSNLKQIYDSYGAKATPQTTKGGYRELGIDGSNRTRSNFITDDLSLGMKSSVEASGCVDI
jgi:hypothetical protein